jgi:YidC/Oxa1 family membrane protein insertase
VIRAAYDAVIHAPLYNAIVALLEVVPGASLAAAVVILTVVVRLALFPVSKSALLSQIKMREMQPEIEALRARHKDDPQKLAAETMALYRKNKVNPFASFGMILVQIPIFIGLYSVFSSSFDAVDLSLLYPFVPAPAEAVNPFLFGIDLRDRSVALALVAAVAQHLAGRFLIQSVQAPKVDGFQADFSKAMRSMSLYFMPALTFTFSAAVTAALPLYWTIGSIFTIGQELYLRRYRNVPSKGAGAA